MNALGEKKTVRVLHLEDDKNDRVFVREMVCAEALDCEFRAVQTRNDFERALHEGRLDLIIAKPLTEEKLLTTLHQALAQKERRT